MSSLRQLLTFDSNHRPVGKPLRRTRVVSISDGGGLIWRGPDYPLLPSGRYTIRGVVIQGPQWLPNFRRWSLRIEFTLVDDPVLVSAFFNFGADPSAPKIGRQSRYYRAWVIANGAHPGKGQTMSPEVFLDGQFFDAEIELCDRDTQGDPKPGSEVYSRVTKIFSAKRP